MATLIKADGTALPIEPKDGKSFQLQELYEHLKTDMVQVIGTNTPEGDILILDEEGKLKDDARLNVSATALCRGLIADDDFIVRDAIRCKPEQFE